LIVVFCCPPAAPAAPSIDISVQCTYNVAHPSLIIAHPLTHSPTTPFRHAHLAVHRLTPTTKEPAPHSFHLSAKLSCVLSKGNRNLFTKHFIVPPIVFLFLFLLPTLSDHNSLPECVCFGHNFGDIAERVSAGWQLFWISLFV